MSWRERFLAPRKRCIYASPVGVLPQDALIEDRPVKQDQERVGTAALVRRRQDLANVVNQRLAAAPAPDA